jgi:hypothetical protein
VHSCSVPCYGVLVLRLDWSAHYKSSLLAHLRLNQPLQSEASRLYMREVTKTTQVQERHLVAQRLKGRVPPGAGLSLLAVSDD